MAETEYSERAADWLRDAEPDVQEQVMKRIEQAQDFPDHFLDRPRGSEYYKLRAGDYRAIIDWQRSRDPEVLFVREIDHRSTIYD
ncbi:type II toxin-antitoxin system RelE/ParE family toxin [Natronococcus sp. JC468]|uniref:type II toxin-antitoxin system RelE family toxin n=1 Tax=Natronococcus sp. JC468 TaxID=1961921 RepID=UPI001438BAFB|nr:type II toxin-antitoxin system RelE/ParE family toxin [Natronococcus sp. JC468]